MRAIHIITGMLLALAIAAHSHGQTTSGAGFPTAFPSISTNNYLDIGAAQSLGGGTSTPSNSGTSY